MAKKKALTYREILLAVKKQDFAPVYLLSGEEPYYLDKIADAIEKYAVAESDRDFNCDIFYGQDADLDLVSASCRQFPFMADRRLVMLKEAQTLRNGKTALEALETYMKRPSPQTVFVVVFKGAALSSTSKMVKAAAASGAVVFNSQKVRDYNLAPVIKDYAAENGMQIDEKATAMLADYVGADISKLFGEIDKLQVALGPGNKRITPEAIERNIGVSKDYNNFELTSALATNNYEKAMKIVRAFSRNPKANPTVVISATLFNFYQKMTIATMERDRSDANLMRAFEFKTPYALKDIRSATNHINFFKARRCVQAIRDFDAKSKGIGSLQNDMEMLKELVYKLFTASPNP